MFICYFFIGKRVYCLHFWFFHFILYTLDGVKIVYDFMCARTGSL